MLRSHAKHLSARNSLKGVLLMCLCLCNVSVTNTCFMITHIYLGCQRSVQCGQNFVYRRAEVEHRRDAVTGEAVHLQAERRFGL